MQHPLELEIHDRLSTYLAKKISLREFEDWFFPKTWDVDKLDEPALLDLVYQIKLNWAEYSDGDLSEKEFRSMLSSIAQRYSISAPSTRLVYGTSSKNLQFTSTMRSDRSSGIKSSVVYG
jgi:hypothetical protein